jgi:hypothetical protein
MGRQLSVALGVALATLRLVDYGLELVLRLALQSQPMCFRVTQANPGDDDLRETIRLHPSAFNALALQPGGQVILCWGDQRVAVRALEDHSPITDRPSAHVMHSVGLHLDEPALPEGFPAHLVARVPASVRRAMNIPPNTVIEVRRRLRPAVVSQLNQLTVRRRGLWSAPRRSRPSAGGHWSSAPPRPWSSGWRPSVCPGRPAVSGRSRRAVSVGCPY